MEGAAVGVLLCSLAFGVAVGTLIGAVFLRAAVALYNKMAGGGRPPGGVPEPDFGKALGITFVTTLINIGVGFVIGMVTNTWGAAGPRGKEVDLLAQAISFPLSLLIMTAMLTAILPTTFGRALLVTLCYMLIVMVVVAVIVGVMIAVFGIAMVGAR